MYRLSGGCIERLSKVKYLGEPNRDRAPESPVSRPFSPGGGALSDIPLRMWSVHFAAGSLGPSDDIPSGFLSILDERRRSHGRFCSLGNDKAELSQGLEEL